MRQANHAESALKAEGLLTEHDGIAARVAASVWGSCLEQV
jgi:hypothetical protein